MEQPITYELATHRNKDVIFIRFDYCHELNERVRKLVGVQWSRSQKAWYVLNTPYYQKQFDLAPPLAGKDVITHIHPVNQPAFQYLIETLQLKAYS